MSGRVPDDIERWRHPRRRYGPAWRHKNRLGSVAVRTEFNGRVYDSAAEARRAAELDLMLRGGQLTVIEPQVTVTLGLPEIRYRVDFRVVDRELGERYEEVKGVRTEKFEQHVRLWRQYGPGPLYILTPRGTKRWAVEIVPGGGSGPR